VTSKGREGGGAALYRKPIGRKRKWVLTGFANISGRSCRPNKKEESTGAQGKRGIRGRTRDMGRSVIYHVKLLAPFIPRTQRGGKSESLGGGKKRRARERGRAKVGEAPHDVSKRRGKKRTARGRITERGESRLDPLSYQRQGEDTM